MLQIICFKFIINQSTILNIITRLTDYQCFDRVPEGGVADDKRQRAT